MRAVAPPKNLLIVILDLVPAAIAMPHRALEAGEQVWSNLMDPVVASQLIGGSGCCRRCVEHLRGRGHSDWCPR
ncbi:MAG: hypothetical protein ACRDSZ_09275 [Pseudonocardiaceae bacterium]